MILTIYSLLDRSQGNQFHYYQPGIGTYVNTTSLEHTSAFARFKSWYDKAKDSAVGTSFSTHVMAGYRFLMRYYSPEDDIYFFGFSRGAYTARFLAEMLDHVGLLSAGNEELQRFAWKCFSKWQSRRGGSSKEDKEKELEMYTFMKNFRETFSRPVRRIRFLGLFDTVNSVPRFESAWMQRSKFPYTARSSAKVIRHAVSIDERRAKFRQDLISGSKAKKSEHDDSIRPIHRYQSDLPTMMAALQVNGGPNAKKAGSHISEEPPLSEVPELTISRAPTPQDQSATQESTSKELNRVSCDASEHSVQLEVRPGIDRRSSYTAPVLTTSMEDLSRESKGHPEHPAFHLPRRYSDSSKRQDIVEVWFPGGHADIGGGWTKVPGEKWALSHAPLVWMVQEAQKAGLKFDKYKMAALNCSADKFDDYGNKDLEHEKMFKEALHQACQEGYLHDCLEYGGGLPLGSVVSWKIMEYLPFRRMDLQADGSWKAIRWPLPAGETRDIPADAKIHCSAIKRMKHDESYRPGNLILMGKGGRGVKKAPKKYGIGQWDVGDYPDDPVKETYVKKPGTD